MSVCHVVMLTFTCKHMIRELSWRPRSTLLDPRHCTAIACPVTHDRTSPQPSSGPRQGYTAYSTSPQFPLFQNLHYTISTISIFDSLPRALSTSRIPKHHSSSSRPHDFTNMPDRSRADSRLSYASSDDRSTYHPRRPQSRSRYRSRSSSPSSYNSRARSARSARTTRTNRTSKPRSSSKDKDSKEHSTLEAAGKAALLVALFQLAKTAWEIFQKDKNAKSDQEDSRRRRREFERRKEDRRREESRMERERERWGDWEEESSVLSGRRTLEGGKGGGRREEPRAASRGPRRIEPPPPGSMAGSGVGKGRGSSRRRGESEYDSESEGDYYEPERDWERRGDVSRGR